MNWYSIFYWLTVADNARSFFWFFAVIFSIIAMAATITFLFNLGDRSIEEDNRKVCKHWMFWAYPFVILFWCGIIFTPSKRDALLIVAGGGTMEFLASDSTAKKLPHDMLVFVQSELKSMAAEAKVEFLEASGKVSIEQVKQNIREEAKKMTTDEVLAKMKADTTFANALLK